MNSVFNFLPESLGVNSFCTSKIKQIFTLHFGNFLLIPWVICKIYVGLNKDIGYILWSLIPVFLTKFCLGFWLKFILPKPLKSLPDRIVQDQLNN